MPGRIGSVWNTSRTRTKHILTSTALVPLCFAGLVLLAPSSSKAQSINVTAGGTETINVDTTIDDINFAGNGTINGTGALIGAATSITVDVTGSANTGTIDNVIDDSASGATDTTLQINGGGGTGTVRLNAANTYVGGTTLNAGGVLIGNRQAFGTGTVTAADGTTIEFSLGPNQTVASDLAITGTVTLTDSTRGHTLTGDISGTGGITKSGSQGITFQGTNTFSGGVNVQQGFVSFDSASAAGTGDISLADNTSAGLGSVTLGNNFSLTGNTNIFQSGGNATLNGVISGTGSWDKGGDGIINLSNNHTFTGSLDVLAGTIRLNGTSTLATDTITVDGILITLETDGGAFLSTPSVSLDSEGNNLNVTFRVTGDETIGAFSATDSLATGTGMVVTEVNGVGTTLTFGDASNTTFDGLISGTGNLVKQGTGTFSLVADTTYSGSTNVNAGIFDLSGSGALASTTINITGAELQTDGGGLAAGANVTVGNGAMFDVNGDETIDQLANSGTVDIAANQTLTVNTITQTGGLFTINGALNGATTINGGSIGGTGTLNGAVAINNGGTFAPGNSIGTTNVNGNLTFNSGSTYQVEVNPDGTSDLIQVTGTATINGGTVSVLPEAGDYAESSTYTILTAAGGVTGNFDQTTIDQNFAFLTPGLRYGTNAVFLDLVRNSVNFAAVAETPNQVQVANALDASQDSATGNLQTVINEITIQSARDARNSFADLNGEIHPAGISATLISLQNVVGVIVDEVDGSGFRFASSATTEPGSGSDGASAAAFAAVDNAGGADGARTAAAVLALQAADERRKARHSYVEEGKEVDDRVALAFGAGVLPPVDGRRFAGWLRGFGTIGNIESDGNGSEVDHRSAGMLAGVESKITDDFIIGATVGYFSTHAEIPSQEYDSDGFIGAIMARYEHVSGIGLSLAGGAAFQAAETRRRITVGGFAATAEADYDSTSAFVSGELFTKHRFANGVLKPFVGLDAIFTQTDPFTETGAGTAGLNNGGEDYASIVGRIGVALSGAFSTSSGMAIVPSLSLAYAHEFEDTTPNATFSFVGGAANFVTASAERGADRLEAKAGLAAQLNDRVTLVTTVEGTFSESDTTGAATARMRIAF